MSDTTQTNSDTKAPAQKRGNELGISRTIYSAGTSARDALIGFAAISATLVVILTFGKNLGPVKAIIEKAGKFKQEGGMGGFITRNISQKLGDLYTKVTKPFNGPIVAASVGTGWALSHIVMLPGIGVGIRNANRLIDKHNLVLDERDQLVETNKILLVENSQLKSRLSGDEVDQANAPEPAPQILAPEQKAAASFTSRVNAQPEPAGGLGAFL